MTLSLVAGADILIHALGVSTPTAADEAWADLCAGAINGAIETALNGYEIVADSAAEAELARAALIDGIAAYQDRDAPNGILTMGPDGAPVRVRADPLRAAWPPIHRYAIPGIG